MHLKAFYRDEWFAFLSNIKYWKSIIDFFPWYASLIMANALFIITECYTEKPKGFCSCAFRNCCSWGWGNWYAMRLIISFYC